MKWFTRFVYYKCWNLIKDLFNFTTHHIWSYCLMCHVIMHMKIRQLGYVVDLSECVKKYYQKYKTLGRIENPQNCKTYLSTELFKISSRRKYQMLYEWINRSWMGILIYHGHWFNSLFGSLLKFSTVLLLYGLFVTTWMIWKKLAGFSQAPCGHCCWRVARKWSLRSKPVIF